MSRAGDVAVFYELLDDLRRRLGGFRTLRESRGSMNWPKQGVYFFFEDGETRSGGKELRVTRVGTHAVSAGSRTSLWKRLSQHKGSDRGDFAGGGSHRGSVFRRHVGNALLTQNGYPEAVRRTWGKPYSRRIRADEHVLELDVSSHIRAMPFLWVSVPGLASPENNRAVIERNSIALLSNLNNLSIDPASRVWLGRKAHKVVKSAGLWNVQFADKTYDSSFLELLNRLVSAV